MLRKLILTVALAALYKGEPPQLGGSLCTIFCFLLGHLLLKPYLNQGLNVFQRTSVSFCLRGFPRALQQPLSADCMFAVRAPAVVVASPWALTPPRYRSGTSLAVFYHLRIADVRRARGGGKE